jgi:hypothetical protein
LVGVGAQGCSLPTVGTPDLSPPAACCPAAGRFDDGAGLQGAGIWDFGFRRGRLRLAAGCLQPGRRSPSPSPPSFQSKWKCGSRSSVGGRLGHFHFMGRIQIGPYVSEYPGYYVSRFASTLWIRVGYAIRTALEYPRIVVAR